MSNVFKPLDQLFPTLESGQRHAGEVVGVTLNCITIEYGSRPEQAESVLYEKRKSWYVNASVNAFHMHRSLVRDLVNADAYARSWTARTLQKRAIAAAVYLSYLNNYSLGDQHTEFTLYTEVDEVGPCVSLRRIVGERQFPCFRHYESARDLPLLSEELVGLHESHLTVSKVIGVHAWGKFPSFVCAPR